MPQKTITSYFVKQGQNFASILHRVLGVTTENVYVQTLGQQENIFQKLDDIQWKKFELKKLNIKKKLAARIEKKKEFWDITTKPKIGIL